MEVNLVLENTNSEAKTVARLYAYDKNRITMRIFCVLHFQL
jgi:hypothetical protein